MYLIFDTYEKAQNALAQIDANMGFPDGNGTTTWAIIQKAHNQELWFFVKPNSVYMNSVVFDEERNDISDLILEKWQ